MRGKNDPIILLVFKASIEENVIEAFSMNNDSQSNVRQLKNVL